jgi:uncharacterized protein (DUF486 family)
MLSILNNLAVQQFLLVLTLIIGAWFNACATYYNKINGLNQSFYKIYMISVGFAVIEYIIKVPGIYYFGKSVNSIDTAMLILICMFGATALYTVTILKEPISINSIVTIIVFILVYMIHMYVKRLYNIKN